MRKTKIKKLIISLLALSFILASVPVRNDSFAADDVDYMYEWYRVTTAAELYEVYSNGMNMDEGEEYEMTENRIGRPILLVYNNFYVTDKYNGLSLTNLSNIPEFKSGSKKSSATGDAAFESLGNVSDLTISQVTVDADGNINFLLNQISLDFNIQYNKTNYLSFDEVKTIRPVSSEDGIFYSKYDNDIIKSKEYICVPSYEIRRSGDTFTAKTRKDGKLSFAVMRDDIYDYNEVATDWDFETTMVSRDLSNTKIKGTPNAWKTENTTQYEYLTLCNDSSGKFYSGIKDGDHSGYEVYIGRKVEFPTLSESTNIEDYLVLEGFCGIKEGCAVTINDGAVLVINGTCVNKGLIKLNGGTLIVNGVLYGPADSTLSVLDSGQTYCAGSIASPRNGTIIINPGGVVAMYSSDQKLSLDYNSFVYNYGVLATAGFTIKNGSGYIKSESAQSGKGYVDASLASSALSNGIPYDKLISDYASWYKDTSSTKFFYEFSSQNG